MERSDDSYSSFSGIVNYTSYTFSMIRFNNLPLLCTVNWSLYSNIVMEITFLLLWKFFRCFKKLFILHLEFIEISQTRDFDLESIWRIEFNLYWIYMHLKHFISLIKWTMLTYMCVCLCVSKLAAWLQIC